MRYVLYTLAAIGLVVLAAILASALWIGKTVKNSVTDLSCSDYLNTLSHLNDDDTKISIQQQTRMRTSIVALGWYIGARSRLEGVDTNAPDYESKAIFYGNQFTGLCKIHPEQKLFELFKPMEKMSKSDAPTFFANMFKDVPTQQDASATLVVKSMVISMKAKQKINTLVSQTTAQ